MADWQDYTHGREIHTVTGALKVLPDVFSPQLHNQRDILVSLPPSYAASTARRYPVIYMHDGQNLFDEHTSYSGEWGVDETLAALAAEGLEAIAVGIPNMGDDRIHELSPFHNPPESDGRGDAYLRFIIDTVKPLIDADFCTLPGRETTGLLGSSMGGLISLYGFLRFGEVFGLAGVFSPALWFGERAIFPFVEKSPFIPGRIYMDVGTSEGLNLFGPVEDDDGQCSVEMLAFSSAYQTDVNHARDLLLTKGYTPNDNLRYVVAPGDMHHESAWARRLPDALRFLLEIS